MSQILILVVYVTFKSLYDLQLKNFRIKFCIVVFCEFRIFNF